ncbi:transcription factor bHLH76 [Physcomitrium patens]|uniref:BHLH domain-containing protein n=1 Tax=Physcomitrium patens TaxID=3218 RepID=A0A2K1JJ38_PHYPA|nr:transcription factor bHLH49-like [Physcomitrium patens]XP_024394164.1 transcription factor bHLH49-like [Physcomitrium patens]PNR41565.1 hypothetical protein PHYPA_018968 [Physcomitrium patens]|eukprot:XP_024394163.1 transcription factor bHLH49-like [Physcomitrella patens]
MAERVNTGSLDLRGAVSSTAGARSGCGIQEECSTVHQDTVSSSSMKQSAGLGHGSSSASRNRKGFSAEQRCLNSISKCDGCEPSASRGKKVKNKEQPPKQGFIHVRARRGQATNSHSLAERARREKISNRMKFLQALVPGCSEVTGKAVMLEEIINYVKSLQRQIEFLSMKLAAVDPRLDTNVEGLLKMELHQVRSPESTLMSPDPIVGYQGLCQPHFHIQKIQQQTNHCNMDLRYVGTLSNAHFRRGSWNEPPTHAPPTCTDYVLDSLTQTFRESDGSLQTLVQMVNPQIMQNLRGQSLHGEPL